jgi:hypothetical protein
LNLEHGLPLVPDRGDISGGGDIEERLVHQFQSHIVELAISGADAISQDDDVVAEVPRASRRAFNPAFGGDTTDEDGFDSLAAQYEIEIGSDEAVRPPFLEDDILRLRL